MMQICFSREIDKKATRTAVEQRLESVRLYKRIGFVRREMKVTSLTELRFHGATNVVSKQAENIAIWNVDTDDRMKEEQRQVEQAVTGLSEVERQVIRMRYLEDEEMFDYNVYSELNLSERKYYRVKSSALCKLAFALRLEKYAE